MTLKPIITAIFIALVGTASAQTANCTEGVSLTPEQTIVFNPMPKPVMNPLEPQALLVWNVYKHSDRKNMLDLKVLSLDFELMALQEIWLHPDHSNSFQNQRLQNFHFVVAPSFKRKKFYTGVSVATRYNYKWARPLKSPTTEPIAGTPKMALFMEFPLQGREDPLLLVNLQAINFRTLYHYEKQISLIAEGLSLHHGPIILAGDFNTWSLGRKEFLQKTLVESELRLSKAPIKNFPWWRLQLDQVFYRGFDKFSVEALTEIESSDHLPLRVEFEFSLSSK